MENIIKLLVDDPDRTNAIAAVTNTVVAIAALLVAAISIYLTWSTSRAQTKHNRLSVKPIPFLVLADYENRLLVKLLNNGSGPLIVKTTGVQGNDKFTESLIAQMPPLPKNLFWSTFTSGMKDRSLLPGAELFFVELVGNPDDPIFHQFRDQCRQAMSKLSISITYTDIYDGKFPPYNRALDWFARNLPKN